MKGAEIAPYAETSPKRISPKGPGISEDGATPRSNIADLAGRFKWLSLDNPPQLQDTRGTIHIPKGDVGKSIIELMQTADASTFVHEAAHFFAALLEDLSARADGDSPLKARAAAMRREFGDMATPQAQEKFARGFEAYLRRGDSPAPELRDIFERFREWLVEIYAGSARIGIELTPEMARFYDELMVPDLGNLPGPYGISKPRSAGAAATGDARMLDPATGEYREVRIEDFSLPDKASELVERSGLNLTPNSRINKSPLVALRRLYANLAEDQRDTAASRERIVGTAVETQIKVDRGLANEEIYRILGRKGKRISHPTLPNDQFGRRILDAMANPGDELDPRCGWTSNFERLQY